MARPGMSPKKAEAMMGEGIEILLARIADAV
jgi:hypothetical protein